jgi:hypothetical protein
MLALQGLDVHACAVEDFAFAQPALVSSVLIIIPILDIAFAIANVLVPAVVDGGGGTGDSVGFSFSVRVGDDLECPWPGPGSRSR